MRKLLLWLSLFFCCVAAAQPTSIGGITPGKTTRNELKSLVNKLDKHSSKDFFTGEMKQPEGTFIFGSLQDDVVYEVLVLLTRSPELKQALVGKYGPPNIKVGSIQTVTCKNKFGASFTRLDGREELLWPVKDGVQGGMTRSAVNCADYTSESYILRHIATVKAIEAKKAAQLHKQSEERRRKLDGVL